MNLVGKVQTLNFRSFLNPFPHCGNILLVSPASWLSMSGFEQTSPICLYLLFDFSFSFQDPWTHLRATTLTHQFCIFLKQIPLTEELSFHSTECSPLHSFHLFSELWVSFTSVQWRFSVFLNHLYFCSWCLNQIVIWNTFLCKLVLIDYSTFYSLVRVLAFLLYTWSFSAIAHKFHYGYHSLFHVQTTNTTKLSNNIFFFHPTCQKYTTKVFGQQSWFWYSQNRYK